MREYSDQNQYVDKHIRPDNDKSTKSMKTQPANSIIKNYIRCNDVNEEEDARPCNCTNNPPHPVWRIRYEDTDENGDPTIIYTAAFRIVDDFGDFNCMFLFISDDEADFYGCQCPQEWP